MPAIVYMGERAFKICFFLYAVLKRTAISYMYSMRWWGLILSYLSLLEETPGSTARDKILWPQNNKLKKDGN
jgi:hypothetical protein